MNGHTCPGAEAGSGNDGRVNLCKNCGHGMMYHATIINDHNTNNVNDGGGDPNNFSLTSAKKTKSSRKWGALRQMVKASKHLKSRSNSWQSNKSTTNKSDDDNHYYNNQYQSNQLKSPLMTAPVPTNNNYLNSYQQYQQQNSSPPSSSKTINFNQQTTTTSTREMAASRVVKKDNEDTLARAGWLDLQAHSGLRVDDTVSAHATIDDDLIDPKILDQLRYSISATCAKLQQRRKALHAVVIKRYRELKQEASKSENLRDRLRSLGNTGMNINTDFSQF
jgi:hypothetical protein